MKLWLPKWLREERTPDDAELEHADRRLFLKGLTLTSAGLVVGVPLFSVPKPQAQMRTVSATWASIPMAGTITFYVMNFDIRPAWVPVDARRFNTLQDAISAVPKGGPGRAAHFVMGILDAGNP